MTKKTLLKFSLITLIIGVLMLAITFYTFHFVTDSGLTLTWHDEAGKPFVTEMLGNFGVLMVGASTLSLIGSFVFFNKDDKNNNQNN